MRNKTRGRSHEQNKRATKDHSRTDRDKSACQESISVLLLWPLSQTIQPAQMKKNNIWKQMPAANIVMLKPGGKRPKLLRVTVI